MTQFFIAIALAVTVLTAAYWVDRAIFGPVKGAAKGAYWPLFGFPPDDAIGGILMFALVLAPIPFAFAYFARRMAIRRGRSQMAWTLASVCLGPVPLMLLTVLPKSGATDKPVGILPPRN